MCSRFLPDDEDLQYVPWQQPAGGNQIAASAESESESGPAECSIKAFHQL